MDGSGVRSWSGPNVIGLAEEIAGHRHNCKPNLTRSVRRYASEAQQLREQGDWQRLSLEHALVSLERNGCLPSVENLTFIVQKCRKQENLVYAKRLHNIIRNCGLEDHGTLGNYIVPMFVKCGSVSNAQEVFDKLIDRNEFSWTSLIEGYFESEPQRALNLFQKMQEDHVHPSKYTFVPLLKACARLKRIETGRKIHTEIAKEGFETDPFVGNTIVGMYSKCGSFAEAWELFFKLPLQDVVSWTALIAGYADHGLGMEALNCLSQMQLKDVSPNAVTFVCCLKACGSMGDIDKGRVMHADITRAGFEKHSSVGNTLVDMYAKCGSLVEAQEVFDKLPGQNVVSWNALIAGYAEQGLGKQAVNCMERMKEEDISLDAVTYVCSLKACGSVGALEMARRIHSEVLEGGFESNYSISNTLVDIYFKCGSFAEAWNEFNKLLVQDVVSWTALIAGYTEHGLGEEALNCLEQMQLEAVAPNIITLVWSLKACGSIGAVEKGRELHAETVLKGFETDIFISSTVVDMYAKCGSLAEAQQVFDTLSVQDVVLWNALMAGYARQGESELVSLLFERLRMEGIKPDGITFLSALTACSHTGLVDKGLKYFEAMSKECAITPTLEHQNCMLDLLGRAGQFDEAVLMLEKMPSRPDLVTWSTMLSACQKWGSVEFGRHAFECSERLNEQYAAVFI